MWRVGAVDRTASSDANRSATERVHLATIRVVVDELERAFGETEPCFRSGLRRQLAEQLELLARILRTHDSRQNDDDVPGPGERSDLTLRTIGQQPPAQPHPRLVFRAADRYPIDPSVDLPPL